MNQGMSANPRAYFLQSSSGRTEPYSARVSRMLQSQYKNFSDANYFNSTSRIVAAPGAGNISRTLQQRLQTPSRRLPDSLPARSALGARSEPGADPESLHNTSPEEAAVLKLPGVPIDGKDAQSGETTSRTAHSEEGNANTNTNMESGEGQIPFPVTEVKVPREEEACSTTEDAKPRPKLTASNSGADITLGLETDEGQCAEVEIDTADQDELMPETEAPKGRVRKASITEKVIKSKASEALAAMIKEEAETRQKEFEKLLDEHAELVQEISRTPSSENLIQGERDH